MKTVQSILRSALLPPLEAEILLAHTLQVSREWIIAHAHTLVEEKDDQVFQTYVARRKNHEPIAYITEVKEFYGREFIVSPSVLIPRPSTEVLIERVLQMLHNKHKHAYPLRGEQEADTNIYIESAIQESLNDVNTIVDVGTGCGCIGITLAKELPHFTIIATDVSESALNITQKNAEKHDVVHFNNRKGSLLEPVSDLQTPFLVVANLPYIPNDEVLMEDVQKYEPHAALFGGEMGNELVHQLIDQCTNNRWCKGYVVERRG